MVSIILESIIFGILELLTNEVKVINTYYISNLSQTMPIVVNKSEKVQDFQSFFKIVTKIVSKNKRD